MTITDADWNLAARIFHPGFGMDCAIIAQQIASYRLAAMIEGRRQMQSEIERALRIYPEWCANWGMDRNMKAATAAANECADMLKVLPTDLPEDDEDAGCAIAAAIRAIPLEPPA